MSPGEIRAAIRRGFDQRPFLRTGWPFAIFLLSPFVVYPLEFVRSGLLDGGDDVLSNLPMLVHSARALLRLDILWTPALWLGTPLVEEPEFATFYLPRLGLLALPLVTAFAVYVLAHYVLAQTSFYAYARTLELSRGASVFGALVYAFSGFMLGHRGHTMYLVAGAWAPLFFLFLRRLELGRGRFSLLGASLSFAALPLSGALQLTAYLVLAAFILQSVRAVMLRSIRPLGILFLALIPASLVGALQILPSLGLSAELVDLPGDHYAFSTLLSYDPRLLPLLVTPLDPLSSAELYSRIGGVALVFAAAAVARRRDPMVAGWLAVAASALVLMLGHYVPILPRVIDALPIVGVFRGPVRHNFELGLSMAVLSAIGFEKVFTRAPRARRIWAWLSGAAAACVLARFLAVRAARSQVTLPDARAFVRAADHGSIWVGAAMLGFGIAALALANTRARRFVLVLCLASPLVDARYSLRRFNRVWPDWAEQLSTADVRGDGAEFARVLPPPLSIAGPDALAANTPLLFPGLGHLLGYASRAHRDVATVLDADLHGHPREPFDLAWSRLPEVFGISFLILPDSICAPLNFDVATAAPDRQCREGSGTLDAPLASRELRCREQLTEGRTRFHIAVKRPPGPLPTPMRVEFAGRGPDARVFTFDFHERRPGLWLSGPPLPAHGYLSAFPIEPQKLKLDSLRLDGEVLEPIVELDNHAALFGATPDTDSFELASEGPVVRAEKWFDWPPWLRRRLSASSKTQMEVEAVVRAAKPPDAPLTVDLYGSPDYDPLDAQIAIPVESISSFFSTRVEPVEVVEPPQRIAIRALYEGREPVEVQRARLLADHWRPLVTVAERRDATGVDFGVDSGITVGPFGRVKVEYHLPARPVKVELVVDPRAPAGTTVVFGVRADPGTRSALEWQHSVVVEPSQPSRFSLTAAVPPTARALQPFAASPSGAAVVAHELGVRDACSQKSLFPVRTLDSGWVVYRDAGALPRAFTVSGTQIVRSLAEARHTLRDDPDFDPKRTALVLGGAGIPQTLVLGEVTRQSFGVQSAEIEVRAAGGSTLLVVNDRYDERWRAELDGIAVPIHRVNGLVRGVVVPAGTHTVRMHYAPPWTIPAGGAACLLGLALSLWIRPRSRKSARS